MNIVTGKRIFSTVGLTMVLAVLVIACGSQQSLLAENTLTAQVTATSTNIGSKTATPESSAVTLVREAAATMKSVKSLHFEQRDTVPDLLYPTEGDYTRPDKARGIVHNSTKGDIHWIRWGKFYFVQDNTGAYQPAGQENPGEVFVDFAQLSDVVDRMDSATLISQEQVDGIDTTYVEVIYDRSLVLPSVKGKARYDLWIGQRTKFIYKLGGTFNPNVTPGAFDYYSRFNELISPPIEFPKLSPINMPSPQIVTPIP